MKNILKIIYLVFFILVFYVNTLRAEILKEIIIEGNERISEETLIVYGEIQRNKNYTQEHLVDALALKGDEGRNKLR